MKLGFALPNIGPVSTAEAVTKVAQRAEALGYESLWTVERLLYPVKPQTPYPVTPDGMLPEPYKHVLDPVEALTFAAAKTTKIGLGVSVLDIPYYNPVMLARRLSTLDFLSNGRLLLGLGLGWSKDEMDAASADMKERGARADEFLDYESGGISREVLPGAEVLHRSEAGAEATSAYLSRSVCAAGSETTGDQGRWVESSGNSRRRHGANVWRDPEDGEGSGARSFDVEDDRTGEPGAQREASGQRPHDFHGDDGADQGRRGGL
jgi:Luciferase-like monooxygenase